MLNTLSAVPVLVTGASGFIGGRLVERLVLQCGARVRVLVRTSMGAASLARFPIEVYVGDIRDPHIVNEAANGCAVVFNCAKGTEGNAALRRTVDVDGVRYVVEAAKLAGARVVHVSTMVVYNLPYEGDVDEGSPDAQRGDAYADTKLEGERLALELGVRRGVPVTVIQPTVVYGPRAGVHGLEILDELREGQVILVDGGTGICNAVYIDDLVTGLLLAAASARSAGRRFLVSGPEYPTWRDFFAAFERMLGMQRTVSLSQSEALALWQYRQGRAWLLPEALRAVAEDQVLRNRLLATREGVVVRKIAEGSLGKRLFPISRLVQTSDNRQPENREPPLVPLRPWLVRYLASRARIRSDKARELLGYEPVFRLNDGMRLTEEWARWSGLIP